MTMMDFFGCAFIAFGPPVALFIFTIARDALRVIVLMASAFFWLLGLLLSSILWFAVVPLREDLAFGLVFSVLFQEGMRFLFWLMLRKANEGLKKVSEREGQGRTVTLVNNRHLMAYVCGLGFGMICGAFSLVNVLADMTGPGTVGIYGDSDMFFIVSAFLTLCFIFLHIFWGVIFFAGLDKANLFGYMQVITVVLSHMLVSCITLLNQGKEPVYAASLTVAYVTMTLMGIWAFFTAGGSLRNLKAFFCGCHRAGYSMD